jgi:hypothetical protein
MKLCGSRRALSSHPLRNFEGSCPGRLCLRSCRRRSATTSLCVLHSMASRCTPAARSRNGDPGAKDAGSDPGGDHGRSMTREFLAGAEGALSESISKVVRRVLLRDRLRQADPASLCLPNLEPNRRHDCLRMRPMLQGHRQSTFDAEGRPPPPIPACLSLPHDEARPLIERLRQSG